MKERKIENSILWILCYILLLSLLTLVLFLDISTILVWGISFREIWEGIYSLIKLFIDNVDIAGLAALITAIITCGTLFEIRKQRKKMYEPSLTFVKNSFKFNIETEFEDQFFSLYNIGYGAAKEITLEWKHYNKYKNIKSVFPEVEPNLVGINSFFNKDKNMRGIGKLIDEKQEIEYLLPSSIIDDPVNIRVPTIATHYILTVYKEEFFQNDNINRNSNYLIPFTVNYTDINNEKFRREYFLNFKISYFSLSEITVKLSVNRK